MTQLIHHCSSDQKVGAFRIAISALREFDAPNYNSNFHSIEGTYFCDVISCKDCFLRKDCLVCRKEYLS
jgi:hypothetical protein